MPRECRRVIYSGRVQGVGFRFTAERLAQGYEVTGYVRNLDDGRVELLVEGETTVVASFLESVRAAFGAKIRDVREVIEAPVDPPLEEFTIRY